jgi:hypothetical protein
MGGGRSLEKLLELYQSGTRAAPTARLRSLKSWSAAFGWQARLSEVADEERQAIVAQGIAARQNRVDAYGDRWALMRQVITERAGDRDLAEVPGGRTGLLVKNFKTAGGVIVEEFAVDTGLLREMREIEKQAAQDLGQWVERQEASGETRILVDYVNDWRPGAERKANPPALPPSGPDDGALGGEAV